MYDSNDFDDQANDLDTKAILLSPKCMLHCNDMELQVLTTDVEILAEEVRIGNLQTQVRYVVLQICRLETNSLAWTSGCASWIRKYII